MAYVFGLQYQGRLKDLFRAPSSTFMAVLVCAGIYAGSLQAQNIYGSIVGTTTDPSGASVPGAKVALTNTGTGEARSAETDAAGNYQFLNLVPGMYKVEVEGAGFKRFTQDQIQVVVQAAVRVDVAMQVGSVGETVEVSAQALALQTESATISQAVGGRNVTDMPLNGRNVYNLVALVPGVVMEGNTPQIGGGVANQNATYVDGVPMNTGYFNQTAAAPTQDSVEEFRVQTNTASAEFGRYSGGVISLSSKSGTNEFHGTAYEFLRNRVLNANTFFSNRSGLKRPAFTQNQFGGTLGGPIRKNKTFFFASYEGFRQRTAQTYVLNAPTDKMKAGDFSELINASGGGTRIYDALTSSNGANRLPFAGNVIPTARLDRTAVILAPVMWGRPNQPGLTNNYVANVSGGSDNNQYSGRVDHNASDKNRMFGRFTYGAPVPVLVSPYNNGIYLQGTRKNPTITAVFGDTHTFSPTMIGDLRLSLLRNHNTRYPDQLGIDLTTIGWPPIYNTWDTTRTLPHLCVTNYDGVTYCQGNPQSVILVTNNVYSISPSLTKIAGRHTLKFGAELRRMELNYLQSNNNSGNFSFTSGMTAQNALSPGTTGYSFASLMLGYGSSGTLSLNAATTGLEIYQAYYVADTLVVNRKLTLNYGLRWEGLGPFYERHDRQTVLQTAAQNPLVPNLGQVALVKSADYEDRGSGPHPWTLFSPRFGLAYRLTDKWVIRTGAGITFLPTDGAIQSSPFGSPVNSTSTQWVPSQDGGLTPFATLNNPFPTGINQPPQRDPNYQKVLLGGSVSSAMPTNPHAYSVQYNFSVQRELPGGAVLEAAYASLKGVHLYQQRQLDQLPDQNLALGSQLLQQVPNPYYGKVATGTLASPTVAYGQLLRPFPHYTGFTSTASAHGNSRYHSLQVKLEKRFQNGGTLLAAFTKSKLICDVEQLAFFQSGFGAYAVQNYNDLRGERSLAAYDTPNNLVVSYVYDLPLGKGHSLLGDLPAAVDKLVSGWGINGITRFQNGQPLGLNVATNVTNSFGGSPRPNVVAGCNSSVSGSAQSRLNAWFNTACYTAPPSFTFGNASRTDPKLRAAGINNWDFAAFKNTSIHERYTLQFRAEIFNLFNRVQFSAPGMSLGSTTFAVVSGQANDPRLVQLALRLKF